MPNEPAGHLAIPPSGTGRPVLVLHPWWGLNTTMEEFADRLATEGFLAFAPDLYRGAIATDIPAAESLSTALFREQDRAKADVDSGVKFLLAHPAAVGADSGLAVVAFSMGVYYALDLSGRDPEHVRRVVVFYGTGPGNFAAARAEYLGHFAANDPYEPKEGVDQLEAALRSAGRPHVFHTYPGTGHWFFEPDRSDAYDGAAAKLAWERTLAFLRGSKEGG